MKRIWHITIMVILIGFSQWWVVSGFQDNELNQISDKTITSQLKDSKLAIESSTQPILDNNTWSDYPDDDDHNGLYNRLVIDLGKPFAPDQDYGVYGVLKDSKDNLLGISVIYPWEIREGFQLSFIGTPINASGSNGPYIVWVGVFIPEWWYYIPEVNFTLSYKTSQAYDPNDFEAPTANIVGFSDYGNDTNENGYFDEIIIESTLDVFVRGHYEVTLFLETVSPITGSFDYTLHWNGFLTPGEELIEFRLPTRDFYNMKRSGSLNVSFVTMKFYGEYQQILTNAYNTSTYFYNDFEPAFVELTGNYWDQGLDTDSNGKFDLLEFTVEINVTEAGLYYLDIQVYPNGTDDWRYSRWNSKEGYWTKGIHNVTFEIDASSYYSLNDPEIQFVIDRISVHDSDWNTQIWVNYPYSTQTYSYQEFELPKVILTGNYGDEGQDTDLDVTFDQLAIEVEINVTLAGEYRLGLRLRPNVEEYWYYDQWNEASGYFDEGIHNIIVYFDASQYYSLQKEITFVIKDVEIHDSDWNYITGASSPYETRFYSYKEFDKPVVFLTGNYWAIGEDLNLDGKFDQLTIIFEVRFTQAGEYRISYNIRANTSYSDWYEWGEDYGTWTTRIYNLSISIDTTYLYSTHENVTFTLANVEIHDSDWNTISRFYSPFTTRIYDYTEFDLPWAYFTGNYWDRMEDTDSDEKINFLVIDIEVNVTRQGYYYFEFYQHPFVNVWDTGSWESSFVYLSLGIHNVSFQVYVTIPYSFRLDTAYVFSGFQIRNSEDKLINWDNSLHITRIYAYHEFDPPGVYLTGNYWEYGVDTDSDGTFDQINIDLEVNVTQTKAYNFDCYWHVESPSWGRWEGYYDEKVLFEGVQNITIPISAILLYTSFDDVTIILDHFEIRDSDGHRLDRLINSINTRVYSYQEFDTPGAYLTGNYWDHGIDTDSDGKYEAWAIEVEVNVIEAGYYILEIELYCWPGYNYWAESVSGNWEEGIQMKTVSTSADNFYSDQQDTIHFEVSSVRIKDSNGNIISEASYPYNSPGYSPNAFDLRFNPTTTTTTTIIPRRTPALNGIFGIPLFLSILVVLVLRHKRIRLINGKKR